MSNVKTVNATKEKRLEEIWEDDKLGRRADADYLIPILTSRIEERGKAGQKKSYVLNVDSQWGAGKTFFLLRLGKHLKEEGHLVVHVNAWEDDHAEDPLLAVMAAVDGMLETDLLKDDIFQNARKEMLANAGQLLWAFGKGVVQQRLKKVGGDIVAATIDAIAEDDLEQKMSLKDSLASGAAAVRKKMNESESDPAKFFETFLAKKKMIASFKAGLEKLIREPVVGEVSPKFKDGKKAPLFILIDEMDRCRPTYAIALLERVKHLFDIDNIIFIFATDTKQLSHSIKAVYGEGFDSSKYLHRFFDQTYTFPNPSVEDFIGSLLEAKPIAKEAFKTPEDLNLVKFCARCFEDAGSSLRDIEQCMDILHNVVSGGIPKGKQIEGVVMLPLVIAYHMRKEIHLPWGDELFEEIKSSAASKNINDVAWKVVAPIENEDAPRSEMGKVSCWDVLKLYIELSLLDLGGLKRRKNRAPKYSAWMNGVSLRIEHEYSSRGNIQPRELSIRQYPLAIATAGRLGRG